MPNKNGLMSGKDVCTTGDINSNIYVRKSELQNTSTYTQYLYGNEGGASNFFGDISAVFTVPYTGNYMLEASLVCGLNSNITNVFVIGTTLADVSAGLDNEYGDAVAGSALVRPPAVSTPPFPVPNNYSFGLSSTHTLNAGTQYKAIVYVRDSSGVTTPSTFVAGLVLSVSSF